MRDSVRAPETLVLQSNFHIGPPIAFHPLVGSDNLVNRISGLHKPGLQSKDPGTENLGESPSERFQLRRITITHGSVAQRLQTKMGDSGFAVWCPQNTGFSAGILTSILIGTMQSNSNRTRAKVCV